MASQPRKAFLAALAAYLQDNVQELAYVSYKSVYDFSEAIPEDKLPACIIVVGPTVIDKNITSLQYDDFQIQLSIEMKSSEGGADVDDLMDLVEKIEDELIDDPQIDSTCIFCQAQSVSRPSFWGGENGMNMIMAITANIKLKREY